MGKCGCVVHPSRSTDHPVDVCLCFVLIMSFCSCLVVTNMSDLVGLGWRSTSNSQSFDVIRLLS